MIGPHNERKFDYQKQKRNTQKWNNLVTLVIKVAFICGDNHVGCVLYNKKYNIWEID